MSTDIIQWQTMQDGRQQRVVSVDAIKTFLAATLPLMLLTFGAWFAVHRLLGRRQKSRERARSSPV